MRAKVLEKYFFGEGFVKNSAGLFLYFGVAKGKSGFYRQGGGLTPGRGHQKGT